MDTYKYYCEKCKYGTNIKYSLIQHEETELHKTGERKKKVIKEKIINECSQCDYKSENNNNFLTHTLNNHSTKEERAEKFKYYCSSCDFGVFTESSFNKHNETVRHIRLVKSIKN
jgi:hypothetical protein